MKPCGLTVAAIVGLSVVVSFAGRVSAADDADDLIGTIAGLLTDKDKDIRALGLQQVRDAAKGAKATRQFAELLPKLPPESQAGLLDALADRGDQAARPAVLEMLKSHDEQVRDAALRALGSLGDAADVRLMVPSLNATAAAEQSAARASLTHLPGHAIDAAIADEFKAVPPKTRAELIEILAARRAIGTVPNLLAAAEDDDATVREAAMAALGQLAAPGDVAEMLQGVLKAAPGAEREGAEKAVLLVCNRIENPAKRAVPVLAVWSKFSEDQQTALLPTLGRVGNAEALKIVEAAIADKNARRSEAGIRAICLWPDALVAPRLLALFQSTAEPERQSLLLRALTRIAVLHDKRSNRERLDLLKTCMTLATHDDERNYVIKRAAAVRTVDSLRFLLPYLEKPPLAQEACASIVELAHHRELRLPNEAEFAKALDAVIRVCKDPGIVDHAQRYKQNKT